MRTILIILGCWLLLPALVSAQTAALPIGREPELRAAITTYIHQKTASLGYDTRIKRLFINGNSGLPEGPLDYEVVSPMQWEGWGNASIAVIVRQGDRIVRNIPVRIEVEALAEMVVTVRQIDHGSIITAADLALRKQDVAPTQGRYLTRIEDVAGKKVRTTLRPNSPVKADQLEKIPLIKSGQVVTIIAENDRMRITVTGKAKNAGAEGDTISVQNLYSLKEIPARVIDASTVLVVF